MLIGLRPSPEQFIEFIGPAEYETTEELIARLEAR